MNGHKWQSASLTKYVKARPTDLWGRMSTADKAVYDSHQAEISKFSKHMASLCIDICTHCLLRHCMSAAFDQIAFAVVFYPSLLRSADHQQCSLTCVRHPADPWVTEMGHGTSGGGLFGPANIAPLFVRARLSSMIRSGDGDIDSDVP